MAGQVPAVELRQVAARRVLARHGEFWQGKACCGRFWQLGLVWVRLVLASSGTARFGGLGRVSARQVVAVVAWQVVASSGRFWLGGLWQVLAVGIRQVKAVLVRHV